ncbi:hypothetical protein D3C85_1013130 [compost metagenome]
MHDSGCKRVCSQICSDWIASVLRGQCTWQIAPEGRSGFLPRRLLGGVRGAVGLFRNVQQQSAAFPWRDLCFDRVVSGNHSGRSFAASRYSDLARPGCLNLCDSLVVFPSGAVACIGSDRRCHEHGY